MHLSSLIQAIPSSATIEMAKKARELTSQGKNVINLTLGEPDFSTPSFIVDAAKKAADEGYTKYTPVPGLLSLREAISEKFKRDNQLNYSVDQIVVSTGAKQTIANVMLCLLNPGEEVILPAPYWVSYSGIADMTQAKKVVIPTSTSTDFKITPELLQKAITPKSRVLVFSSPCNPTGSVYSREELEALAEVIKEYKGLYVISDEIYEYINYTGKPHVSIASFEEIYDRVITVNGCSKGFAMTGWRIGYMGAPQWLAKACSKLQGQFTSGACAIAQKAAEAALSSDIKESLSMRDAFLQRRDLIIDLLKQIDGFQISVPEGAFYVFPNISAYFGKSNGKYNIQTASDLVTYLLETVHVATVGGESFGNANCIRLSYAAPESTIREAADRMQNALSQLS